MLQVSSVVVGDGSTLPADLVLVGAGARPASGLFAGQLELQPTGGIIVDGSFKVSTAHSAVWDYNNHQAYISLFSPEMCVKNHSPNQACMALCIGHVIRMTSCVTRQ
jgi:NAD(P)H-nitrite reductase large subunit